MYTLERLYYLRTCSVFLLGTLSKRAEGNRCYWGLFGNEWHIWFACCFCDILPSFYFLPPRRYSSGWALASWIINLHFSLFFICSDDEASNGRMKKWEECGWKRSWIILFAEDYYSHLHWWNSIYIQAITFPSQMNVAVFQPVNQLRNYLNVCDSVCMIISEFCIVQMHLTLSNVHAGFIFPSSNDVHRQY
jgi:hypothetical protein